MVFATATDLINSYDVAILCQLVTDTDTPVTEGQLPLNAYIISSIARASSDIRMACQVARVYTDDDLAAIYASSDSSLKNQIVGLCVDRAFGYLINRRAQIAKDYEQLAIRAQMTDQYLESLRKGYKLFSLSDHQLKGAEVDIVQVLTSPLNSITKNIPRYFPPGLPAGKNLFGEG